MRLGKKTLSEAQKDEDLAISAHHRRVEARKDENRIRYAVKFVVSCAPLVLSIAGLIASITWNFSDGILWSGLLLFISIFVVLFSGMAWIPRLFYPLDPLDAAFEKVYKAMPYVTPSDLQDTKELSERRLVRRLLTSALRKLDTSSAQDELLKEASDLRDKAFKNFENFLLPAARDGTLKPETVRVLANVLSSPSMEGLETLNSHLEANYVADTKKEVSLREAYGNFRKTKLGRILESLVFGFGIVIPFSFIYAVATQQDFLLFAKMHPEVVLLGSFTLSGVSYFRK